MAIRHLLSSVDLAVMLATQPLHIHWAVIILMMTIYDGIVDTVNGGADFTRLAFDQTAPECRSQ
ncbi:hypothetical protein AEYBE204_18715 [Asticcacaulis sp. YBE204]|nr:hypothetical protein AEYBE204_18715 [Asticcacaulis sp. YBE204]